MKELNVLDTKISYYNTNNEDYISLTDMLKSKDGDFFISDWLRNRNTIEFLGIWEELHNPDFNYGSIGLVAKAGRYGGTYAHKDIAFEFGMWISPKFKLLLIKEFERLKAEEQKQLGWDAKRELSKINYKIHTDAIKKNLIPKQLTKYETSIVYNELICLANLENINSIYINEGVKQSERLIKLNEIAISQMKILTETNKKLLK